MKKAELVDRVAEVTSGTTSDALTKDEVKQVIEAFVSVVGVELANGNEINLQNFGTFRVTDRAARTGVNPQTGEPLEIAASKSVNFKPARGLKERVNS